MDMSDRGDAASPSLRGRSGSSLETLRGQTRSRCRGGRALPVAVLSAMSLLVGGPLAVAGPAKAAAPVANVRALSVGFVENGGQLPAEARFVHRAGAVTTYASQDAFWLQARTLDDASHPVAAANVRLGFVGANGSDPVGVDLRVGRVSYLNGSQPERWVRDLRTFGGVRYPEVYAGVDLALRDQDGALEYDLLLAPGADPSEIAIRCEGADTLRVDASGRLILGTALGDLIQDRPVTFRIGADGRRAPVECRFRLLDDQTFGFQVEGHDPSDRLVIDPTVSFTSFVGGSSSEVLNSVAIDEAGAIYATGQTLSTNFPTTAGVFDTTFNGSGIGATDVVVIKADATGSTLLYATYIGGTDSDTFIGEFGCEIHVNGAGQATVIGTTSSSNFPVTGGALQTTRSGDRDGFVLRLDAAGSSLVYSTYLGGNGVDNAVGLTVDADGNAYVVGDTSSTNLPLTANAFDTTISGLSVLDGFIAVLSADGSQLLYATLFGGDAAELGTAIAVDAAGIAYVTGRTASPNFAITPGAFSNLDAGSDDLLAIKVDPFGPAAPAFSTAFGGSNLDSGNAIAVDDDGNIYVVGGVRSFDFQVTPNALDISIGGVSDAFVTKMNSDATGLIYSTYLGGSGTSSVYDEQAFGVTIDPVGNMVVVGRTDSANFPTAGDEADLSLGGTSDGFVTRISPNGQALVFSSYIGGMFNDSCNGVAISSDGATAVVGQTSSSDLVSTPGALQPTFGGGFSDAFVMGLNFGCEGGFESFGFGCPGTGGLVPVLEGAGCPDAGGTVTITASNGPPGALSALFLGLPGGPNLPVGDSCTLQVGFLTPIVIVLPLNAQGGFKIMTQIPLDATPGLLNLQLLISDPGAGFTGLSGTNPVLMQIGDVGP